MDYDDSDCLSCKLYLCSNKIELEKKRLNVQYKHLLEFYKAANTGKFGWVVNFEEDITKGLNGDNAVSYLVGFYRTMLKDALQLIPGRKIEELMLMIDDKK